MAGIDPTADPRGARWEARLRRPVLGAAWLGIPTVLLYFSSLEGWVALVAVTMAWSIWLVFLAEAVIMLGRVRDRLGWARGHVFGLVILLITFPLPTSILEGLLAARALSSVQGLGVLKLLYLAKAATLITSAMILRASGAAPRNPALITAAVLVGAAASVSVTASSRARSTPPVPRHAGRDPRHVGRGPRADGRRGARHGGRRRGRAPPAPLSEPRG